MTTDEAKLRLDVATASYAQSIAALETAQANLLQQQLSRDNELASTGKLAQAEAAAEPVSTRV